MRRPPVSEEREQQRVERYMRLYEEAVAARDAALAETRRVKAASLATWLEAQQQTKRAGQAIAEMLEATSGVAGYKPKLFMARHHAKTALDSLTGSAKRLLSGPPQG